MWFHETGGVWHHDPSGPTDPYALLLDDAKTHKAPGGWSRLLIGDCGVVVIASSSTAATTWGWMDEAGADAWIRKESDQKCSVCEGVTS